MNYIYDIVLNFNDKLYDFYDWNEKDNIELYLKIPIFKVEEEVIEDLILSTFTVDNKLLSIINNQTEIYLTDMVKKIKFSTVFVSNNKVVAVLFDNNGKSIKKSYLSIDEEIEALEFSKTLKYSLINYKVIKRDPINNKFETRNDLLVKKELKKNINEMFNNKEYDKINYLFYEIYNEKDTPIDKCYIKLINIIENNSSKLELLKKTMISFKKNKC